MTVKTAVIYIQKDKFQIYTPSIGRVIEFRFVPEIMRDLDVVNAELLENLVKVFVTNNKISPSNLIFVLAENAYFTKDFVPPAQQKGAIVQPEVTKELLQKQADEFIEHVPFDTVVSKSIPLKDGVKVCATNKDFYESIAISFEHLGFSVESVLPGLVFGNGLSLRPVMDLPMANVILQKVSALRQYNLLNQQAYQPLVKQETEEVDEVELEQQQQQNKKPNKKSIYTLVGIVPVLLGLAVVMYAQFQAPPPNWRSQASNPAPTLPAKPVQLVTVTVVPTVATTTSSGNLQTQDLTVQIVNTSNSAAVAQSLLGRLDTYKFKSVSLQSESSVGSASTLVSFSPNTTQDVRDVVLSEVKKYETNVIVQEKQLGTFDVAIVLSQ